MRIPDCSKFARVTSCTLLWALVLHFFVAISLPFIQIMYIVETSFSSNNPKQALAIGSFQKLTQIRLGIWGSCYYTQNNSTCSTAPGYNVVITENKSRITVVQSSWTLGLPIQVIAGGLTLVAFVIAHYFFDKYRFVTLIAVGVAGGASLLALLIELALYFFVKGEMQTLEAGAITNPGPGFWMTFIPLLLLCVAFLWIYFMNEKEEPEEKLKDDPTPAPSSLSSQGPVFSPEPPRPQLGPVTEPRTLEGHLKYQPVFVEGQGQGQGSQPETPVQSPGSVAVAPGALQGSVQPQPQPQQTCPPPGQPQPQPQQALPLPQAHPSPLAHPPSTQVTVQPQLNGLPPSYDEAMRNLSVNTQSHPIQY